VRAAACLAATLAGLTLATGLARAMELTLARPRERDGRVLIEARPASVLNSRIAESLGRGMPATLQLHAELWRDRRGWFDRMESSADAAVRIRYDVWEDHFLIERIGAEPIVVGSVDSVAAVLQRPWVMSVARIGQLNATSRYYVVLVGTLRPLTLEDLQEVEGWLSGEVGSGRKSGVSVLAEIPLSLFEAVRNVAGFGDQKARAISDGFTLTDLFASP
jgi:hypothetical protein